MQKNGEEYYQITLAGETLHETNIGKKLGPSVSSETIVDAVENIVNVYIDNRQNEENSLMSLRELELSHLRRRYMVEIENPTSLINKDYESIELVIFAEWIEDSERLVKSRCWINY